jgi:hypothetical protein
LKENPQRESRSSKTISENYMQNFPIKKSISLPHLYISTVEKHLCAADNNLETNIFKRAPINKESDRSMPMEKLLEKALETLKIDYAFWCAGHTGQFHQVIFNIGTCHQEV